VEKTGNKWGSWDKNQTLDLSNKKVTVISRTEVIL
jgi:hypothetical protein